MANHAAGLAKKGQLLRWWSQVRSLESGEGSLETCPPLERQKLIREQSSTVACPRPLWSFSAVQSNSTGNVTVFTSD